MKVLAITGGIGSGKSTVLEWFHQQNIPTLNADQISKELVKINQPGWLQIREKFGDDVLLENGELDRNKMRQMIFNDPKQKQLLENILHPLIRQETEKRLQQLVNEGQSLTVVEIPLLAETGIPDYIDLVMVTDCDHATQLKRTQERSHLSIEEIEKIIQQQASREERQALADYIIDTNQSKVAMTQKLKNILAEIQTTSRENA